MRFDKVLVIINVQLKPQILQQSLPRSATVIAKMLAQYADEDARHSGSGFYPAIDHLKTLDTVPLDIIESLEQLSWLVAKQARETIQARLRPIFSSVHFRSIQNLAFTLPRVRPHREGGLRSLAEHYSPDTVKVELELSMMRRESEVDDDRAEPYVRKMMYRWLESAFESIEITESRALP